MNMRIEQIVIEFVATEDRLMLTVHANGPSIRIWLTRRYVVLLKTALAEILGQQLQASQPLVVGSNTLMAELMHAQAISGVDMSTPPIARHNDAAPAQLTSSSDTEGPSAAHEAWLAFQLQTHWDNQPAAQRKASGLSVLPKDGQGITFNLDDKLPHALAHMLAQACEKADWNLDFAPLGVNGMTTQAAQIGTQLH